MLHSFVSSLLSLNEVLAALDERRVGDSKRPCVDLLLLKRIFTWLRKQNLFFVHFVSLATALSFS